MATTTGTLTIKGDDYGNIPSFYDMYINASTYEYEAAGGGTLAAGTLSDVLDQYASLISSGGGTMTYTLDGPGTWNAGTDTIVTITISNFAPNAGPEVKPYFLVFQTESYTYPVVWQCASTTVCEGAYEVTLTACQSNYVIPSGLTPNSNYYFAIETNRGKRYVQSVSTNGSGDVQLWSGAPEFPEGFFTPEMFTYTCKAYTDSALTNQVQFTIDNVVYNTINLKFIYTIIVSD